MKKLAITIAAIGLFAACSKQADELPVPQIQNYPAKEKSGLRISRPFLATLQAAADLSSPNPPTACSGDLPGFAAPDFLMSGTSSHLGLLNAQSSTLHHTSCDLSFATMLLTTNVSVDLVAGNRDLIYCTADDVVDVAALLTQTGTTGSITGTWTITGGSGRFAEASGSFTINGIVDFVANTFSCECVGTISY